VAYLKTLGMPGTIKNMNEEVFDQVRWNLGSWGLALQFINHLDE